MMQTIITYPCPECGSDRGLQLHFHPASPVEGEGPSIRLFPGLRRGDPPVHPHPCPLPSRERVSKGEGQEVVTCRV
jgi:hypothetical protein